MPPLHPPKPDKPVTKIQRLLLHALAEGRPLRRITLKHLGRRYHQTKNANPDHCRFEIRTGGLNTTPRWYRKETIELLQSKGLLDHNVTPGITEKGREVLAKTDGYGRWKK